MDYVNWEKERDLLIEDVRTMLRQQEDDQQEHTSSGDFSFNPKVFKDGVHLIYGPVDFHSAYVTVPSVTFGQHPHVIDSDFRIQQQATNYKPFLVQPYVYDWTWDTGMVDGFYVGLYALSIPTKFPSSHTIFWYAKGEATRYSDERTVDAWSDHYDFNDPDFIIEETYWDEEE